MSDVLTNRASFTLAAAITSATQTNITRTSAANGLPGDSNGPASGTYKFVMTDGNGNYEIAQVTGGQGTTTLTIARAVELIGGVQTALASVPSGTVCYAVATASDISPPGGSSVSGTLAANVTLTAGASTLVLTTATLGIGTWLVNASASVNMSAGSGLVSLTLAFGTAAGSFNGPVADEGYASTSSFTIGLDVCVLVTITTAGTLTMSCQSGKAEIVEANDSLYSKSATGYVAVRIA